MAAGDMLGVLIIGGLMGMVGQGVRTVVGLKKLSDVTEEVPSDSDLFRASRIFVGLMIGFIAGVAAVLVQGLTPSSEVSAALLLGLAAAGYAGTDFIEGFAQTLARTKPPGGKTTTTSTDNATSGPLEGKPSTEEAVAAAVGGGFTGQLHEAKKYKTDIDAAAAEYKLAPELIYAVGSRESAWGLTLKPKGPSGTGDWAKRNGKLPPDGKGWGRGLMQIDYAAHEFARTGNWQDPHECIFFGCKELAANIEAFRKAQVADPERAGVAAYNCGRGNVNKALKEGRDIDHYTTGHDYSRDVMSRAEWFKDKI